jgi:hypothetical protein
MPSQDDIKHQQNLLSINRRNLAHYLRQQTNLGADHTPPGVINGILEARANISRIKGILKGWKVAVEDKPDDADPDDQSSSAAPTRQPAATQIGRDQIDARESQGFIADASGPVAQNFGTQNNYYYLQNSDSRAPASMSVFDQRGWNISGNVYNIAGDLNISEKPDKSELIAALHQVRDELDKAKDLPPDEADDLTSNLDSATRAIERDRPNKDRAVEKLTTMQTILEKLKDNVGSALALGKLIGQALLALKGIQF